MRISSIRIESFLGIRSLNIEMRTPVTLICGANASGKSSCRDAVALALTADLGRITLKKDAAALINDNAEAAVCSVQDSDGDDYTVTIARSGRMTDSRKGKAGDPTLAYVLDGQRFSRLDATERRAFLFGLMGVKMDPATIKDRLIARVWAGHKLSAADALRVERVMPLLRGGFDAASKEAKAKATEAKGAWRTTTGEAYGSEKAKTWRAAVPAYDAEAFKKLSTDVQHADVAIASWQQQVGALQAAEAKRCDLLGKVLALREHAAKIERITAKLGTDTQALQAAEQELARVTALAGAGPRVGLVHDLAAGLNWALQFAPEGKDDHAYALGALGWYEREHGPVNADEGGDPEARAKLPDLTAQRDLMQRSVANDRRDLAAAEQAKAEADRIDAELAQPFDAAALAAAREQVATLTAGKAETQKRLDALRSVKAAAEAADAKTADAARYAADVAAWDAIGDALGPDGIPAEILTEALGPVNDRLQQSAADTGWPAVTIDGEMAITYGAGRPLRLCSESERWRADAMVAEAIGHISGTKLLLLDRFDVLDLPGRSEALGWLDMLAETGEVDTVLVCATLKAPPAALPDRVQSVWIEAGRAATVVQQREMAEAA